MRVSLSFPYPQMFSSSTSRVSTAPRFFISRQRSWYSFQRKLHLVRAYMDAVRPLVHANAPRHQRTAAALAGRAVPVRRSTARMRATSSIMPKGLAT